MCAMVARKSAIAIWRNISTKQKRAHHEYKELLSQAREGIPLTKESFYEMYAIISEGVKRGQHIYHIVKSNNLDVSSCHGLHTPCKGVSFDRIS